MKELLLLLKKFFGYTFLRPCSGHHTAYLTERGLVGADAHGWRQVDLFSATGYLSAGYGFGGVPLDRLDEGSSRGVDRQRHPCGGVEQYDAGRGATTGEATLRAGQDQIIVYLPGTDQDGGGLVPAPAGHLAHRYRRGTLRIALGT